MNQAVSGRENTRLIVLISVVATIGGFLFGFDSGVINGTQDGLHQTFRSGEWMQGFEIASMLLGCAIGAFCRRSGQARRRPRPCSSSRGCWGALRSAQPV